MIPLDDSFLDMIASLLISFFFFLSVTHLISSYLRPSRRPSYFPFPFPFLLLFPSTRPPLAAVSQFHIDTQDKTFPTI